MTRPSRSDARLTAEEEARIEAEARRYFEGITPKRHAKPSRSEYSSVYSDDLQPSDQDHSPELHKLRELKLEQQRLVCDGSEVVEDYVETEYYKDLSCIDKQHHTTGTGFIRLEETSNSSFDLTPIAGASAGHPTCKGNPATNEWIPSADPVIPVSNKPSRSDI